MDSNQDFAINMLTVLSEEHAYSDSGCATFNGGIVVKHNIVTKELESEIIETSKIKVSDSVSILRNLLLEGAFLPFSNYSVGTIGNRAKKWNEIHCINAYSQQIISNKAAIANLRVDNISFNTSTNNINDNVLESPTINIFPEFAMNIINLISLYDTNRIVTLVIPSPDIGVNFDFKKIYFRQNKCNVIKWVYNETDYTIIDTQEQIIELVNNNGKWIFINYNSSDVILDSFDTSLNSFDTSLNSFILTLDNFDTALNSFDTSLNRFNTTLDNFDTSLNRFNTTLNNFDTSLNNFDTSLNSFDTSLNNFDTSLNNFDTSLNNFDTSLNNFDTTLDSFDTTLDNFNTSLDNFDTSLNNIQYQVSSLLDTIDNFDVSFNSRLEQISSDILQNKELLEAVDIKITNYITENNTNISNINESISNMSIQINNILQHLGL